MKVNAYKIQVAQKFLNEFKKELKKINCVDPMVLETYSSHEAHGYKVSIVHRGQTWSCKFWGSPVTGRPHVDRGDDDHPSPVDYANVSYAVTDVIWSLVLFLRDSEVGHA